MKRVLVTGATGFIGQHCLPILLNHGFEVHALTRKDKGGGGIYWHTIDLLAESAKPLIEKIKPTHMLHFAWATEHGKYWTDPVNEQWYKRSVELLQAFAEFGGKRFVTSGTCAEYDWSHGECVEGVTPEKPATIYGKFKKHFTDELFQLSTTLGVSSAVGRVFFVYGPGESKKRLVHSVCEALMNQKPAPCSNGLQVRDFIFVEDLAAGFLRLLESDFRGPVNLASPHSISVKELLLTLASELNAEHLLQFGAIPRPAGDPDLLIANTKRAEKELSWVATTPLEKGLRKTIEWVRSQGDDLTVPTK